MNNKYLDSETKIPQVAGGTVKMDTFGTDQVPATRACHICHGQGYIWKGEDTDDCPNSKCESGRVPVNPKVAK